MVKSQEASPRTLSSDRRPWISRRVDGENVSASEKSHERAPSSGGRQGRTAEGGNPDNPARMERHGRARSPVCEFRNATHLSYQKLPLESRRGLLEGRRSRARSSVRRNTGRPAPPSMPSEFQEEKVEKSPIRRRSPRLEKLQKQRAGESFSRNGRSALSETQTPHARRTLQVSLLCNSPGRKETKVHTGSTRGVLRGEASAEGRQKREVKSTNAAASRGRGPERHPNKERAALENTGKPNYREGAGMDPRHDPLRGQGTADHVSIGREEKRIDTVEERDGDLSQSTHAVGLPDEHRQDSPHARLSHLQEHTEAPSARPIFCTPTGGLLRASLTSDSRRSWERAMLFSRTPFSDCSAFSISSPERFSASPSSFQLAAPTASDQPPRWGDLSSQPRDPAESNPPSFRPSFPESDIPANGLCRPSSRLANLQGHDTASQASVREFVSHTRGVCVGSSSAFPHFQQAQVALGNTAKRLTGLAACGQEAGASQPLSQRRDRDVEACAVAESPAFSSRSARPQTSADILSIKGGFFGFQNAVKLDRSRFSEAAGTPVWGGGSSEGIKRISQQGDLRESQSRRENDKSEALGNSRNLQRLRSESSQVVTPAIPAVPTSLHESRSSVSVVECMRDGQGKSVVGPLSRLPPRLVAGDSSASSRHSKERANSKRPREVDTRSQGDMPVLLGCLSGQNVDACIRQLDFHRSVAFSEKTKAIQGKQRSAVSRRDGVQEVEEEAGNGPKWSHDRLEKQKNEMRELTPTEVADAVREKPADCFSRVKTASARSVGACAGGVEDRLHQKRDGEETRSWQGVAQMNELAGDKGENPRDRESRGLCIREETTRDQDLPTSHERQCMQGSSRGERTTLSLSSFPMRSMHDFSKELEASLSRTLCDPSRLPAQEFNDSRGPNAVSMCYKEKYAFNRKPSVRSWKFDGHQDSMERTPRRENSFSPLARSQSMNEDALSPVSRLSTQGHDMCCKSRTAAVSEPHYSCARASLSLSKAGSYISQDRRDTPLQSRFSGRASCTRGRGEAPRDGTAEIQTWGESRRTERRLVELGGGPLATQLAEHQSGEHTPNLGSGEDVSPLCWSQRSPSSEWNAPEPEARHGWRFCRDFSRMFAEETESSLRVEDMQPRRNGDREDAGIWAEPNTRKLLTRTVSAPGWEPRRSSWEEDGTKNGKRRENGCRRGVVSAPVCTDLERHSGEFSPFAFRSKKESVNDNKKPMRGVACLSPTQSERTYPPRGDCEEALRPQVLRSKSLLPSSCPTLLDDRPRKVSGGNEQTLEAETPKPVESCSQAESWSRGRGSSPRSHISPAQLNQLSLSSRVSDPGPSFGSFRLSKGTRVGKEINGSKTDTLKQSAAYPEDSSISLEEVETPKATVSADRRLDENVPRRSSLPVNDRGSGSSTLSCSHLRMPSPHSYVNRHSGGESTVGVLRTHADSRATAGEYHDGRGSKDLGDTNAWEERERTHVRSRLNTGDSKTSQKGAREEGPAGPDVSDKLARECAKVLTREQTEGIFLRSPTLSAPLPPRRTPSFDGGRGFTVSPVQKPVRKAAENRCAQRGDMPDCGKSVSKNNVHSCCTKKESKKYSVSSPSRTGSSSRHCQWGHMHGGADTPYPDGFSGEKAETASEAFSSEEDLQTQTVEGAVSCRSKGRAEKRTDSLFEKGQLEGSTGGSPPSPISRREDAEIFGRSGQSCRTHVDGSQETREDSSRTKDPSAPDVRPSKIQGSVDKASRGSTAARQDSCSGPQLRCDSPDEELCAGKEGGRHKEAFVMEKNKKQTSSRRFQVTTRRSPALAEAREHNGITKLGKDWEIQEAPAMCSFGEPSVLVRRIVWEVRPGRPICRCLVAPLSEASGAVDTVSAARAGSCTSSRGRTTSAGFPFSLTDEKGTECEGGSVRLQQGTGTRLCVELLPCSICGGLPEAQFVNV
ncbi:hypothetical protein TGP89_261730 [Toxoplasma gondii p89]|uniref:Uncharacterized protein n=1 Tax=Toxoplasma gondii p89 TaxID=943119 RepID=A0A086K576_TOXGO|nr:hypothetical protein TGP89_261730 [Toxoplasma gondii p89]